jgi:DNA-directed RNA polymerase beta' subunit
MAVHLPITPKAQQEAKELMVTSKNLLAPSS